MYFDESGNGLWVEKDAEKNEEYDVDWDYDPIVLLFVHVLPDDVTLRGCFSDIPIEHL